MSKIPLAIAMIVKNEESVIERCLRSALSVTPHIVIIDTGSTDNTVELARSLGAYVGHFEWINDFSAARNYSFEVAKRIFDPEYIMWLDADDVIKEQDAKIIKEIVEKNSGDFFIAKYVYHHDEYGNPAVEVMRERIIRASLNLKWKGMVHETIPSVLGAIMSPFSIHHYRPDNRKPNERNLKLYEANIEKYGIEHFCARDLFYYARELRDAGQINKCLETYKNFVNHPDGWWEDKAHLLLLCATILN